MLTTTQFNPDVLSCLANLSSDEVFTPPKLANEMLDLLPEELWSNKDAKFLDPVCKTGVFLREIAKRLLEGLKDEIPDLQKRIDHIFKNQLYGIAITELTALMSRRTLYCSKHASGEKSVVHFDTDDGNILFERIEHTWTNGKCSFCGTSKEQWDKREDLLEKHAYQFIHTQDPNGILNMKFDVIIGNPPYQLSDGGAQASATPLYHEFVQQAIKMDPRHLVMIIPARWFSGGKGLNDFRTQLLNDTRLRTLVDYFDSTECFPGVDISGGICYFHWNRDSRGDCQVISVRQGKSSVMSRPLLERDSDIFIRFNEAIPILRKVRKRTQRPFSELISSRKPFGLDTSPGIKERASAGSIKIYAYPKYGYIDRSMVSQNAQWIDKHKVYISYAYGERGSFPYLVIGKPFYGEKGSCCSETFLVIGPFESKSKCENVMTYMRTKFFRFLVLLRKNTQHATKTVYDFVPMLDINEAWSDERLNSEFGLSQTEVDFIDSMIRPMDTDLF